MLKYHKHTNSYKKKDIPSSDIKNTSIHNTKNNPAINIKQQKYKITLEYNGNCFFGWQYQKNRFSVQEALMIAGSKFSNMPINVYGSSRTDVGVHATHQVCHMVLRHAQPYQVVMGLNFHLNKLMQDKKKTIMSVCKNLYKICEYDVKSSSDLKTHSATNLNNFLKNALEKAMVNSLGNTLENILENPTDNVIDNDTKNSYSELIDLDSGLDLDSQYINKQNYNCHVKSYLSSKIQEYYGDLMEASNLRAIKKNLSSKLEQHFGDLIHLSRITQFHNPIVVKYAELVNDNFHARFDAKKRKYVYKICNRQHPTAIHDGFTWWVKEKLSINAMKKACELFIGTHDFKYFRSVNCQSKTTIKTVDECKIVIRDSENIEIHIESRSFLHNQVRLMVAAIKKIGAVCALRRAKTKLGETGCKKADYTGNMYTKRECTQAEWAKNMNMKTPERIEQEYSKIELANVNYPYIRPIETNYIETKYEKHQVHNIEQNINTANYDKNDVYKMHNLTWQHNQVRQQNSEKLQSNPPHHKYNTVDHEQNHIPPRQHNPEVQRYNHSPYQGNSKAVVKYDHVHQKESAHQYDISSQFSNLYNCCQSNECQEMLKMLQNALSGKYDKKNGKEEFKLSIAPANALYLTEVIY